VSVTRGHVAGSQRKTIESLREANAGLCRELERLRDKYNVDVAFWKAHAEGKDEACTALWAEVERLRHSAEMLEVECAAWKADRAAVCEDRERLIARVSDLTDQVDYWMGKEQILAKRVKDLEAALREWREAESSPDCVACCTLDAALADNIPRG
jgi:chromosome segregation ATPase